MAGNRIDKIRDIGQTIPDPASTDPKPLGVTASKGISNEFMKADAILPLASGMIIQVASDTSSTLQQTTSSSWQTKPDPAPSLITKIDNSKILVMTTICGSGETDVVIVSFRREINGGINTDNIMNYIYGFGYTYDREYLAGTYLDSPNQPAGTEITYKINFRNQNNSTKISVGHDATGTSMTLMEIMP